MAENPSFAVVVPWVREQQRNEFLARWHVGITQPPWLIMQHDANHEGCGATKNKGIAAAMERGAEVVVVLDDDCFPPSGGIERGQWYSLEEHVGRHIAALKPQQVKLFVPVTAPPSRGTPYACHHATLPVAASMGFWNEIGDYCAVRQLAHGSGPMEFLNAGPMFWRYFPLCGMNLAFRPSEWMPWCRFIDVPRFDDIWMGWLWQSEAYRRGHCFNLGGPLVTHSRQSNVWVNLKQEVPYLEANELLWQNIAFSPLTDYESLSKLLPVMP